MKWKEEEHPYRVSAQKILALVEPDEELIIEIIRDSITNARLALYNKYKNEKVRVLLGELEVDCFIHDVKVVDGQPQYQVKPVAGSKAMWVTKFKL